MLNQQEIIDRLCKKAEIFKDLIYEKEYYQAKYQYDTAVTLAVELHLDQAVREELFGIRGERGVILKEGLFPERLVQKAYYEACVKAQDTHNCEICRRHFGTERKYERS